MLQFYHQKQKTKTKKQETKTNKTGDLHESAFYT